MIDFACKRFQLDEVIKCGFGLTKADFNLMKLLLQNYDGWYTTESLAKDLKLNISTVQRSVKRLHEKGVINRSQENLQNGGYLFMYQIKDKKVISKLMMDIVKQWVQKVEHELDKW